MTSKLQARLAWINEHRAEIIAAATPINGTSKNARYVTGMSGGGWGYWVHALDAAGLSKIAHPMTYWSGSNPTPSTAINQGVAEYIRNNAPEDIK